MSYYISYAIPKLEKYEKSFYNRLNIAGGHSTIFLSQFDEKKRKWQLEHAFGFRGNFNGGFSTLRQYISGNDIYGHVKNEWYIFEENGKSLEYYIRTYPLTINNYFLATQFFALDREIAKHPIKVKVKAEKNKYLFEDDEDLRSNSSNRGTYKYEPRELKGPNYNMRYFNCHKYALKTLVRLGIVDWFLLKHDLPPLVNERQRNFQEIVVRHGKKGKNYIVPKVVKTFKPEPIIYPGSYYKMANTVVCGMKNRYSTTEQLRNYIWHYKRHRALYSLAINLLNDYRKTNFNRIIHFKRHNTKQAERLIGELKDFRTPQSFNNFYDLFAGWLFDLPEKSMNPNGSFFRRLLFLKELNPQQTPDSLDDNPNSNRGSICSNSGHLRRGSTLDLGIL
ncbi:MAG: hypothetical protein GY718_11995 [Lentisphaerae bacterium]|nr:hypothetical protein [Lentisphaerota bacterium]